MKNTLTAVQRLTDIYEAVREAEKIDAQAQKQSQSGIRVLWVDDFSGPLQTRLDCVTDRVTGLRYAAWCIGETLGAIGGLELMHEVSDLFENVHGGRGGSWLDHRWDGVSIEGDGMWVV